MSRTRQHSRNPERPAASSAGRTQHLVDLENLLAGRVSPERTHEAFRRYELLMPIGPEDDVVVGLGPRTAPHAAFDVPARARVRVGGFGPDSADHALLHAIDPWFTVTHFQRVVIASGDHAFGDLARTLRGLGVTVVLMYAPQHVAADLYVAATDSIRFPELEMAA